jgi:predicted membrane channel-forming protein YqfA (hemolysin III family)
MVLLFFKNNSCIFAGVIKNNNMEEKIERLAHFALVFIIITGFVFVIGLFCGAGNCQKFNWVAIFFIIEIAWMVLYIIGGLIACAILDKRKM